MFNQLMFKTLVSVFSKPFFLFPVARNSYSFLLLTNILKIRINAVFAVKDLPLYHVFIIIIVFPKKLTNKYTRNFQLQYRGHA